MVYSVQPFAAGLGASPPIGSQTWWQNPEREAASSDPDTATAQTIRKMARLTSRSAKTIPLHQVATTAVHQFSGLSGGQDAEGVAGACWWWCKTFVKFVHHEFILRQRLGEYGHLQGLIEPAALLSLDPMEGDCAIFSMMLAAMLKCAGLGYEFVTVAVNPQEPSIFSHVYLYAVMPDGRRIPMDASHGMYPGWQVPSSDVSRLQAWDESGSPVSDRGPRFSGLHNYGLRGLAAVTCDPESGVCMDEAGATVGSFGPGGVYSPDPTTYTAPAQTSSDWASFAATLAKAGLTLAEINAIQPGTVVGPNGQILRQTAGYAVPVGGPMLPSLGGSSNLLLIGGGLLALVVVMSMAKK